MAQLVIRAIDDALEKRLRARASHNGRSLEAEVYAILEDAEPVGGLEPALREEGAPMLSSGEKGLGDLMYQHFRDRGLTDEEFARFNIGIAEINSMDAMRIPDFEADEFEEAPSDK
jgi:plasmid stability protein